jgi:putative ABC transport system permease protein
METLMQDLRYAARALRRNPVFTLAAVLTLAIGIGANTAVFSVVNAVLLRSMPYPDPDRLVVIWGTLGQEKRTLISLPDIVDMRARNRTFDALSIVRSQSVNLTGVDAPDRLIGSFVSANALTILGATAERGRLFTPEETEQGSGAAVAVLSHGAWMTRFGGDPNIIGRSITLNGRPHVVIGVTAAAFRDPMGGGDDVWLPVLSAPGGSMTVRSAPDNIFRVWSVGRMKRGVTIAQAQADLNGIATNLAKEYPVTNVGQGVNIISLEQTVVGEIRPVLLTVFAFVMVVLLIACANVANLQLARATAREKELSVRAALGAGRGRIIRQLLTESVLLSGLGGALGILVGVWATRAMVASVPGGLPSFAEVTLDPQVLGFSILVTLGCGVLFGLAPALFASRANLRMGVGAVGDSRQPTAGVRRWQTRDTLVAGQLALCVVLLVGAGLLTRSLLALRSVDAGFDATNVETAEFRLPRNKYDSPAKINQFMARALAALRAVPGVKDASLVQAVPLSGNYGLVTFELDGKGPSTTPPTALQNVVSDGFFRTMRIPLRAGRDFDARDRVDAPQVAIVSEEFARGAWPGESAIGRRVKIFGPPDVWVTVVGVVGDVKQRSFDDAPTGGQIYQPMDQGIGIFNSVAMRTAGDPDALGKQLRAAIWSVDPDQPVWKVRSQEFLVTRDFASRRFALSLAVVFALLAVVLAAIGVYGVMSYMLAQRTRELGIRLALGAKRSSLVGLVLSHGMRVIAAAVAVGSIAALGVGRLMQSQLYGIGAADPVTFLAVTAVLCAVAVLATYIPARRAADVDPLVAIRSE